MSVEKQTPRDRIETELEKSNSKQLKSRVRQLCNRLEDERVELERVDVEVGYNSSKRTLTNINVKPRSDWIGGGGGYGRMHVILGPRGGVRLSSRDTIMNTYEYHDKKNAWGRTIEATRRVR